MGHSYRYLIEHDKTIDHACPENGLTWQTRFNMAKAWNDPTQTYPITTYSYWPTPCEAVSIIVTPEIDLSAIIGGRWTLYYSFEKIGSGNATITPYILYSNVSGGGYTQVSGLSSHTIQARYARAKFVLTQDVYTFTIIKEPVYLFIEANPVAEYGEVTVPGSGVYSVVLVNPFLAITKVVLTPMGNAPRIAVCDNLTIDGFDIVMFDAAGAPAGGNCKYEVQGF